eukprot:8224549-Pyramimonas_sp.AAC.1
MACLCAVVTHAVLPTVLGLRSVLVWERVSDWGHCTQPRLQAGLLIRFEKVGSGLAGDWAQRMAQRARILSPLREARRATSISAPK